MKVNGIETQDLAQYTFGGDRMALGDHVSSYPNGRKR